MAGVITFSKQMLSQTHKSQGPEQYRKKKKKKKNCLALGKFLHKQHDPAGPPQSLATRLPLQDRVCR